MADKIKEVNRKDLEEELSLAKQKLEALLQRIQGTQKLLNELNTEFVKLQGEHRGFERILNVKE